MESAVMERGEGKAKPCSDLLREFEARKSKEKVERKGVKLKFLGVEPNDVYNPTPPFFIDGQMVIAARVEPRVYDPGVIKPKIYLFKQIEKEVWTKIEEAPVFELEDPFVTTVNGDIIIGGVEVSLPREEEKDSSITYRTIFNKSDKLGSFEQFAVGPEKMKDIRIIELRNGHIGVFTRPQGGENGGGKICYIELDKIDDLKIPEKLSKAKVIELFSPNEWGGANQLHELEDGRICVIGHIACFSQEHSDDDQGPDKNYYAMSFIFDPKTHTTSSMKIIATRADFPPGEAKKSNLQNVIFVGGIAKDATDGEWYLYAGLGDVEAGRISLENPF